MQNPSTEKSLLNHDLVRGALAGIVATVPMVWATRGSKISVNDEIISDVTRKSGYPLDTDDRRIAAYVAHFGFGAVAGAMYTLAAPKMKAVKPTMKGPLFALTFWGASAMARKARGDSRMTASQKAVMIGSHLAWGMALTRLLKMTTSEMLTDLASGVMGHTSFTRKLHHFVS